MAHVTTPSYWTAFAKLPKAIQDLAKKNYELLKADPKHPSLHFARKGDYWAVRIGGYRALGVDSPEGIAWFWIGKHDEYERIIGL